MFLSIVVLVCAIWADIDIDVDSVGVGILNHPPLGLLQRVADEMNSEIKVLLFPECTPRGPACHVSTDSGQDHDTCGHGETMC